MISAITVLTMIAGSVPVMGASAPVAFESVTAQAAGTTVVEDFLDSAVDIENVDIAKDDAFNMNGRTYYEGVILKGHYGNENRCTASFNVENLSTLSFTLGHVDNANGDDGILNIYIDNKFYDTVELSRYMNLTDITIDVSDASVIRFNAATGEYTSLDSPGTYGIANISITEKQANTDNTLGDIDFDGKITGSDATFVLQAYTKMSSGQDSGMSDAQYKVADVDSDGIISGSDATLILRYYTLISSSVNGGTTITIEEWLKIELK